MPCCPAHSRTYPPDSSCTQCLPQTQRRCLRGISCTSCCQAHQKNTQLGRPCMPVHCLHLRARSSSLLGTLCMRDCQEDRSSSQRGSSCTTGCCWPQQRRSTCLLGTSDTCLCCRPLRRTSTCQPGSSCMQCCCRTEKMSTCQLGTPCRTGWPPGQRSFLAGMRHTTSFVLSVLRMYLGHMQCMPGSPPMMNSTHQHSSRTKAGCWSPQTTTLFQQGILCIPLHPRLASTSQPGRAGMHTTVACTVQQGTLHTTQTPGQVVAAMLARSRQRMYSPCPAVQAHCSPSTCQSRPQAQHTCNACRTRSVWLSSHPLGPRRADSHPSPQQQHHQRCSACLSVLAVRSC
jgi:hypothetical protein